jgi:single-strand DNA-binding protein
LNEIAGYKFYQMIKLQVIGHLGKDCLTNVVSGKNVINFSVAHSEKYKDNMGNQKERTTWVECAYWTDRIAIAPYLKKGQLVYVEGAPDVKAYSKNDGTAGASLNSCFEYSIAEVLTGLRDKAITIHPAVCPGADIPVPAQVAETNDDLPFRNCNALKDQYSR